MASTLDQIFTTSLPAAATRSEVTPFDAVVVGGGTAGIVAALTLVEKGLHVALLEAGPLLLLTNIFDTDLRFNQAAQAQLIASVLAQPTTPDGGSFGRLYYCLGGRGLFWTGATPRFDERDFVTWPFSYRDLQPHYEWAENLFGVNDSLGNTTLAQVLSRRLRLAGLPAEPGPTAIDRPGPLDDRFGGNVGNALGPLLRSQMFGNTDSPLTICTNSFATTVVHDGHVAKGVEVTDETGAEMTVQGNSVVLACGGFESVRIALSSKIPDESGMVGKLISDHLFVRASFPVDPAMYSASVAEQAVVYVRAAEERPFQLELHAPNDNLFALDPSLWRPAKSAEYSIMVRSFAPVQARVENYIELAQGDRRAGYVVHLSASPDDQLVQQQMVSALRMVKEAIPADDAECVTLPFGASHHESGGLCAGADSKSSVVDRFGIFHHLRNVAVVDASLFPSSTPYNPHLTIAAVARRNALAFAEPA